MSQVYLVADAALSRRIAVKLLRPNPNAKVDVERFRREIQIVARLQHPCIVPVLTTGIMEENVPYYTMPFVSGESLRAKITAGHQFSLPRAVRVIRDVASAIAYAHEHGVAHLLASNQLRPVGRRPLVLRWLSGYGLREFNHRLKTMLR